MSVCSRDLDVAGGDAVFAEVFVGIDETPESLVAAVQADVLRRGIGRLVLVAVAERYLAAHAGLAAPDAAAQLEDGAQFDLLRASALVDADETIAASGRLVVVLRSHCERRSGTLMAVGARPHRRLEAVTFGGHDVEALRTAACSVLIARPGWGPHLPDRIVVAVDGSPASQRAAAAARSLADRLQRELVPVVGLDGGVDPVVLRAERADALLEPGPLVDAVARVATRGSLVIAGRGGGDRRDASERLVFKARCSVLLVGGDRSGSSGERR